MDKDFLKIPSYFLIIILIFNFLIFFPLGNQKVKAGIWESHKGSITTVLKGILMLWIMNLIRKNTGGDNNEDLLTSTITKGLNLEENSEKTSKNTDNSSDNNSSNNVENNQDNIETNQTENSSGDNHSKVKITSKTQNNENNNKTKVNVNQNDNNINKNEEKSSEVTNTENKMLHLINQERKSQGLKPLDIDKKLTKIARLKAEDMKVNDYFEHYSPTYGSPFDMMQARNINYLLAGENIASAPTVEKGFQELMNSPDHKANILEARYDQVGIGIIEGGKYGLIMVQIFTDVAE